MTDKFRGSKYEETKDLPLTEIAKRIKQEIRERYPRVKVSVRTEFYSMGCSVDVWVQDADFNPINPEWLPSDSWYPVPKSRYTEQGKQLLKDIEGIVQQYNRDNSDSSIDYFEVRFYSSVEYTYDLQKRYMEQLGLKVEL